MFLVTSDLKRIQPNVLVEKNFCRNLPGFVAFAALYPVLQHIHYSSSADSAVRHTSEINYSTRNLASSCRSCGA
jgi:hypothetical protein